MTIIQSRRGRRHGPALSQEVELLLGQGNQAYVDNKPQDAVRIMTEVIRIEPRAFQAYSVLSMCYRSLGERQKALTFAIFGAHLRHDAEEWHAFAKESEERGFMEQALICLTRATKLDPNNLAFLWDKAVLAQEIDNLQAARAALLALLKRVPHDTGVLEQLRHILVELGELQLCADLYQQAFDYYTSIQAFTGLSSHDQPTSIDPSLTGTSADLDPLPALQESQEFQSKGEFTLMEVLVLADLYNTLGRYEKAITVIRAGCRWLDGRADQKYWDACPDDREYDPEDYDRKSEHDDNLGSLPMERGFYPLDVNARHRLAIARLKANDIEEGLVSGRLLMWNVVGD